MSGFEVELLLTGVTGGTAQNRFEILLLLLVTAPASAGNHRFRYPSRKATWRFKASTPLLGRFCSQADAFWSQRKDINSSSTATCSGTSIKEEEMENPAAA
jgi:hypothetical protein